MSLQCRSLALTIVLGVLVLAAGLSAAEGDLRLGGKKKPVSGRDGGCHGVSRPGRGEPRQAPEDPFGSQNGRDDPGRLESVFHSTQDGHRSATECSVCRRSRDGQRSV